jgi:hypothetical protein
MKASVHGYYIWHRRASYTGWCEKMVCNRMEFNWNYYENQSGGKVAFDMHVRGGRSHGTWGDGYEIIAAMHLYRRLSRCEISFFFYIGPVPHGTSVALLYWLVLLCCSCRIRFAAAY